MKPFRIRFRKNAIFFIAILTTLLLLFLWELSPKAFKKRESIITTKAATFHPPDYHLNGRSFQQDAIITYNNYQYAVYYNAIDDPKIRHISISRRQLPDGAWEHLEFKDYNQTKNDSHNVISMGICPTDGTIHLAFDMHADRLHYRRSIVGLTTNPAVHAWEPLKFGPVQNFLTDIPIERVTYPRFIMTPKGQLQLVCRIGVSGDGDSILYEYNGKNQSWICIGKFIEGGDLNPYLNGMTYDKEGRLHVTWCWRQNPDPVTNHDLMYAYSDDEGRTWRNNSGAFIGKTENSPINPYSIGIKVWDIPQNSRLINQEGQTVDLQRQVHVLMRDDLSGSLKYVHYYRDTNSIWHRNLLPITPVDWYLRGKIAADKHGNVYAILPNLFIAQASAFHRYADWKIIYSKNHTLSKGYPEPLYDSYRWTYGDGGLSIYAPKETTIYVLDFVF